MRYWKSLVLALLAALTVAFGAYRWWTSSNLDGAEDRVRAAGYPVTYAELDEYYARPESGENRADLLLFAFESMVMPGPLMEPNLPLSGSADLPHRTEPIPEEQVAAMRAFSLLNLDAIDAVFESFVYDECRFPIDLNAGPATELPHLPSIRMLARRMSAMSLLASMRGDTENAATTIAGIIELADSLDKEPLLISQLVRQTIYGIGLAALEQALNRADFSEDQLRSLQDRLAEAEANQTFVNGYIGERCTWTVIEQMDFNGGMFGNGATIDLQDLWINLVYRPSGLLDLDGIQFYKFYEQLVAACALPIQEQIGIGQAISDDVDRHARPGSMLSMLLPGIARSLVADVRHRAHLHVASVALAAARYKAAKGTYPESAAALVPDYLDSIPIDPCGGAPIRYRALGHGFVAYSLAENGTDENGEESVDNHPWRDGDLTFTIERPDTQIDTPTTPE